MNFTQLIGNPPYDNQLYRQFLEKLPSLLSSDERFDLLFPVYTFTRKRCIDILSRELKLESIDMTTGFYFNNSVSGAWVVRMIGGLGRTDTFSIKFPDGTTLYDRKLSDVNPCGAKFIEATVKRNLQPLTIEDYTIASKVLTSTIKLRPHKDDHIAHKEYVYLHPVLNQMSAKRGCPFPGAFSLRGWYNQPNKDGFVVLSSKPEIDYKIYCESKLFVYLYWIVASDSQWTDSFIKLLPDVSNLTYKNDTDLYQQFGLTDKEIERIESIVIPKKY